MLERLWRKGNPPLTLLVGMQTSTATMENSMEITFKKLKIELPYDPIIPLLGMYLEKTLTCKDTCMYIFEINSLLVASFAISFSHSEGCLFTLLIVSFVVQSL